MGRPKFSLDCRRDKVYTSREWEEIIALHVAGTQGPNGGKIKKARS